MTETSTAEHTGPRVKGRTNAQLPLFIYGSLPGGDPFHEEPFTTSFNETGGLTWLPSRVDAVQEIMLRTKQTISRKSASSYRLWRSLRAVMLRFDSQRRRR